MRDWRQDKHWADKHLPEIERVIRSVAGDIISIDVASDVADQSFATDYIVRVQAGDIACRIRKWPHWIRHHDFTLRSSRPSGIETELAKIQAGFARWYLYAWAKDDLAFGAWVFVDLDRLRDSGLLDVQHRIIPNPNGSSNFIGLSLTELDDHGCLLHGGGAAAALIRKYRNRLVVVQGTLL